MRSIASGPSEAIEKWGYLDFSGTVAQTSAPALGTPLDDEDTSANGSSANGDPQLSPYVKGFENSRIYRLR